MSTISRAVVMLSGEVAAARARLMSASTTSRFILLKQSVELYVLSVNDLTRYHLTCVRPRLQTLVFVLFLFRWTNKTWYQLRGRGLLGTTKELYLYLRLRAYGVFLSIPAVRKKIKKDVLKATDDMEHQLAGLGEGVTRYAQLPIEGWTADQVKGEMSRLNEMEHDRWEDGRVSGAVYFGEADLVDVQTDAIKTFMTANPIHPAVWPGVRKMEAEIVAMV
jgi:sphinganine-1-phosphate aldolase